MNETAPEKPDSKPSSKPGPVSPFLDELGDYLGQRAASRKLDTASNPAVCKSAEDFHLVTDFMSSTAWDASRLLDPKKRAQLDKGFDCKDNDKVGAVGAANAAIEKFFPNHVFMAATSDKALIENMQRLLKSGEAKVPGVDMLTPPKDTFQKPEPLVVGAVDQNSQAYKAGLRPGDKILSVDGVDMTKVPFARKAAILDGEPGSIAEIKIEKPDKTQDTILLQRERKVSDAITATEMPGNIWRIRVNDFAGDKTAEQFAQAIEKIKSSPSAAKGIILDLRNNMGGMVDEGLKVLQQLIPDGNIMLSEYRQPSDPKNPKFTYNSVQLTGDSMVQTTENAANPKEKVVDTTAREYTPQLNVPIEVLTNGHTASVAEMVAAALKQNGNPNFFTAGEPSFGKSNLVLFRTLADGVFAESDVGRMFVPVKGQDQIAQIRKSRGAGQIFGDGFTQRPGLAPRVALKANGPFVLGSSGDTQLQAALAEIQKRTQ